MRTRRTQARLMLATLSVLGVLAMAPGAQAATWHIPDDFTDLAHALQSASVSAGDTIYVRCEGTSGACTPSPRGGAPSDVSFAAPGVTVRGIGRGKAEGTVCNPNAPAFDHCPVISNGLNVARMSHITFEGLEVTTDGSGDPDVVHIQASSYITLSYLYAHDAGTDGDVFKINQCQNFLIENSRGARPGARTASENCCQEVLDFVDVDDSTIRDNHFSEAGNMVGYVKGDSVNVLIERNVIGNQSQAGRSASAVTDAIWGIGAASDIKTGYQWEAQTITFRNNIVFGGRYAAIQFQSAQGVSVENNLFLNNGGFSGAGYQVLFRNHPSDSNALQPGVDGVQFKNNVFANVNNGSGNAVAMTTPVGKQDTVTLSNITFTNNTFYSAWGAVPNWSAAIQASLGGTLQGTSGYQEADPSITGVVGLSSDRNSTITNAKPTVSASSASFQGADCPADAISTAYGGESRNQTCHRGSYYLGASGGSGCPASEGNPLDHGFEHQCTNPGGQPVGEPWSLEPATSTKAFVDTVATGAKLYSGSFAGYLGCGQAAPFLTTTQGMKNTITNLTSGAAYTLNVPVVLDDGTGTDLLGQVTVSTAGTTTAIASRTFSLAGGSGQTAVGNGTTYTTVSVPFCANGTSQTIIIQALCNSSRAKGFNLDDLSVTSGGMSCGGDTTPPTISGVGAGSITSSGATISWTTNEGSDSQVEYGLTTAYGAATTLDPAQVTSHSQALSGLAAGTLYNYRVKSRDAAGNLAVSSNFTFTTSGSAPSIANRSFAGDVSSWSLTEGGYYESTDCPESNTSGTGCAYLSCASGTQSISQVLSGATATTYTVRVRAKTTWTTATLKVTRSDGSVVSQPIDDLGGVWDSNDTVLTFTNTGSGNLTIAVEGCTVGGGTEFAVDEWSIQ